MKKKGIWVVKPFLVQLMHSTMQQIWGGGGIWIIELGCWIWRGTIKWIKLLCMMRDGSVNNCIPPLHMQSVMIDIEDMKASSSHYSIRSFVFCHGLLGLVTSRTPSGHTLVSKQAQTSPHTNEGHIIEEKGGNERDHACMWKPTTYMKVHRVSHHHAKTKPCFLVSGISRSWGCYPSIQYVYAACITQSSRLRS